MDARFFNSMSEGDFGNGFMLCQGLTEGDFWARAQGCYCVYRGCNRFDNVDYDRIVASRSETGLLNLPGYLTHEANADYYYALRRSSSTGKEEQGTAEVVSEEAGGEKEITEETGIAGLGGLPSLIEKWLPAIIATVIVISGVVLIPLLIRRRRE